MRKRTQRKYKADPLAGLRLLDRARPFDSGALLSVWRNNKRTRVWASKNRA